MGNLQRQWVERHGVSGLDPELIGCHFHSHIIGQIIKWPRPRLVDKRKVFPHYRSFHSKDREKGTIDFRQNILWHTSPKYWIPDWVQFLTVFIPSVMFQESLFCDSLDLKLFKYLWRKWSLQKTNSRASESDYDNIGKLLALLQAWYCFPSLGVHEKQLLYNILRILEEPTVCILDG